MWRIREGYKTPVVRRWLSDDATAIDQRLLLLATCLALSLVGVWGTLPGRKSLAYRERTYPNCAATGGEQQEQLAPGQGRHPQDVNRFGRSLWFATR